MLTLTTVVLAAVSIAFAQQTVSVLFLCPPHSRYTYMSFAAMGTMWWYWLEWVELLDHHHLPLTSTVFRWSYDLCIRLRLY